MELKIVFCIFLITYFHSVSPTCYIRRATTTKADLSRCRYENFINAKNEFTLKNFTHGSNLFSGKFYEELAKNQEGNFVSSSISALILLAMATYGADGNTRQELMNGLHLPMENESILLHIHDLIKNLNGVTDVELHLANKMFIDRGYPLERCFQKILTDAFQSEIQSMDFHNATTSAEIINSWCQDKTKNKIKDIVKSDDLVDAIFMLINAVYFKGAWDHKFSRHLYRDFHFSETKSESIQMMCKYGYRYVYSPTEIAYYIELPFKSADAQNQFSMYIIFPRDGHTLDEVIGSLATTNFASFRSYYSGDTFCMPKFTINSELDLIPTLQAMGIEDMFNSNADFSNLSPSNIRISKVIQKAFLSVDEEGSEASAASGMVAVALSAVQDMVVDKPFIAAIVPKISGIPLFVARVNDPRY